MENSILQQFLDNQFIHLGDDANFDKLHKALDDLKKKWVKDKKKIIRATMVALDPDVNEDDPIVQEVHAAITSKWTTFVNSAVSTKDTPLTYIRALILEMLQQLSTGDIHYAALILYAGRNVIRYYKVDRENEVLVTFMQGLSQQVEEVAFSDWQGITEVKMPGFSSPVIKEKNSNGQLIDKEELKTVLRDASLYSGWGQGGKNPQAPHSNYLWADFFSEHAATGISEQINKALSGNKELSKEVEEITKEYFSKAGPYFETVTTTIQKSYQTLNLKNHLLWWKASLYSSSLSNSYRSMHPVMAACSMAADLAKELPAIHPQSVDFLLKETLRDVVGNEVDHEKSVGDLLQILQDHVGLLETLLPSTYTSEGRRPLAGFLKTYPLENTIEDLQALTGVDPTATVSLGNLAVWLFYDLQALKLSSIKG